MRVKINPVSLPAKPNGKPLPMTAEIVDGKIKPEPVLDKDGKKLVDKDGALVDEKGKPLKEEAPVEVVCEELEASIAMSASSVAVRLVPVDAQGNEHPLGTAAIVGDVNDPDVAAYFTGHEALLADLMRAKGN